jgi:class 3 adenylate cyclase/tetratricopeptide (TPR) repeat protein
LTGEIRRQATIVTSDLKGSTALGERLDPESLREVLTTYFDEMRAVFESHGGTIEKIIGDAIVAVFGLATSRDDDALRAVEAAAESQRALALLNDRLEERWGVRLTVRTGVATGEVVVGEASAGQHVLTGSTIGLATAMEQNAPPLEVLLAASTYEAVRDAVEVEPMGEVQAKGSAEPLPAFRLLAVAERPDAERLPTVDETGTRTCRVCGEANPEAFSSCGTCGAPLAARVAVGETRKTVTIVFADPKPMTADGSPPSAEALRDVMSRYFAAMQQQLARHGATVEKFIGDAVMAVFGLPVRHEDDALRAVRAASDMQRVLPELNSAFAADWGVTLQNHIGVNTGEVVAGDASLGQRLVTGDTVNVAARLEQAAGPREILLGALTYRLVRDAVTVDEVEPLSLKGKAEPVLAYRLLGLSDAVEGIHRRQDTPMIGRDLEMGALSEIFQRAVDERACRMATVVGDAGVGKSRLIAEFTAARGADALVIRGRCLPYGEGITFWPVREAARDAAGIGTDDPPSVAMAKLRSRIGDDAVVERIASVIGLSQSPFPMPEVFWGVRKFLEGLSRDRPVLLVIDDIHWAEATFLELIDHLVEAVDASPILLLCSSRHDLLESHPEWALDERSLRLVLRPLTDADAALVVGGLLGETGIAEEVRGRIVQAAAGNPLFVEQLLSMLIDNGTLRNEGGRWEQVGDVARLDVPPSIQALLAARLDLLAADERGVIEPASVIGQIFAQAAVAALVAPPVGPEVPQHLTTLMRKQLVQPNPAADADGIDYRFQHLLVRDAAYDGMLKRARAVLHERFVEWAEEINIRQGRVQEFEEIQGYHLEQAYRYLTELGTLDDHARSLGARASAKLASAGRRAMGRGDMPAAVNLLRRAAATLPPQAPERGALLPNLAESLMEVGEFDEAQTTLAEAIELAEFLDDDRLGAEAVMIRLLVERNEGESPDWSARVAREVERALPIFERASDKTGQALGWRVRYALLGTAGRYGEAAVAADQVIEHAAGANDPRLRARGAAGYAVSALYGPAPVPEAIQHCEQLATQSSGDKRTEALIRSALAQLYAMRGDFAHARDCYRDARAALEDLGIGILAAATSTDSGRVEILADDLDAARQELERDYLRLGELGETFLRSTIGGLLGRVAYAQDRVDDAYRLTEEVEAAAAADDVDAQALWRSVRACALARRGEYDAARRLAMESVAMRRGMDSPALQAEALSDLAEVERLAGRPVEEEAALREATELYARKGDTVSPVKLAGRLTAGQPGRQ